MITLINHPGLKSSSGLQLQTPSPPIGLAYIGAYLKQHGRTYVAVDACGEALDQVRPHPQKSDVLVQGLTAEQAVARVPKETTIVGFTCLFSHCWPLVTEIATALREQLPDALFVAGGEHPSAMPESVAGNAAFDVVILGEGEETFLELVACVESGSSWRDIAGIAYEGSDGQLVRNPARRRVGQIDDLPYPDWDSWCIEGYISEHQVTGIHLGRSIPILGSRGCPYACTFCSNEQMWTRRYIMRDPVGLADEMEYMKQRYDVAGFTFMDSTFIINRNKTMEFCQELIRRELNVSYQLPAGTRCEAFDEELAFALEASGLRNFALAPESGSERVLAAIQKQVRIDRLIDAVKIILRTKMTVGCFFVVGFPEDDEQSLRETLRLIRRLALLGVHDVTVSKFTPYPGTEYFDRLLRDGQLSSDLSELENVIDFFSEGRSYNTSLSAQQLQRWMLWAFINFYAISFAVRPWRVLRNLWVYWTRGLESVRYVRFVSEMLVTRRKWKQRAG